MQKQVQTEPRRGAVPTSGNISNAAGRFVRQGVPVPRLLRDEPIQAAG
jgi:hypothetical protein